MKAELKNGKILDMNLTPNQINDNLSHAKPVLTKIFSIERYANEKSIAFRFGLYISDTMKNSSFGEDLLLDLNI